MAARITQRRIAILKLVGKGYSTKEISNEMNLSIGNVYKQISGANRHLGVRSRKEAVIAAVKRGYILPKEIMCEKINIEYKDL